MAGIIKVDRVQSDSNLAFNVAGANVAFMDASALRLVGSGITANGTTIVSGGRVVAAAQPSGAVLQVVQNASSTMVNTTTGTDVNLLSQTITPTSSTSKILIRLSFMLGAGDNNSFWMKRNSTKIGGTGYTSTYQVPDSFVNLDDVSYNIAAWGMYNITWEYLDSPATTSAITYTLGHISSRGSGGATTLNFNRPSVATTGGDYTSSITLMEIAV